MDEQPESNNDESFPDDLDVFRISHFMQDISLDSHKIDQTVEVPAIQTLGRTLQDLAALVQVMEDSSQPQKLPNMPLIEDESNTLSSYHIPCTQEIQSPLPNPAFKDFKVNRYNISHINLTVLQRSIRLFVRHLLGVGLNTCVEDWPVVDSSGKFYFDPTQDITSVSNTKGMEFFVFSYTEAYYSGTFHASWFVDSEYIYPRLIQEMYRDYFLIIKNSIRFPFGETIQARRERKEDKRRKDSRRERKRKVCRFRRTRPFPIIFS
jgi:hypothetical protein